MSRPPTKCIDLKENMHYEVIKKKKCTHSYLCTVKDDIGEYSNIWSNTKLTKNLDDGCNSFNTGKIRMFKNIKYMHIY